MKLVLQIAAGILLAFVLFVLASSLMLTMAARQQ